MLGQQGKCKLLPMKAFKTGISALEEFTISKAYMHINFDMLNDIFSLIDDCLCLAC